MGKYNKFLKLLAAAGLSVWGEGSKRGRFAISGELTEAFEAQRVPDISCRHLPKHKSHSHKHTQ